jgi:DNA-binding response OmpR family regulator
VTKTILIIDDDEDWVQMLSMRLQHEGYQVEIAFDAVNAVSQAIKLKPDLVLLDIRIPSGDGIGVLDNLRGNANTFNIPVIALTALSDKQTVEAMTELGISGYFVKPADRSELLEKIEEVLTKKCSDSLFNNKERSMGKKILIVDDEPDLLKVTSLRLKKIGYEVFGGADGQEALNMARQIIPDLIILDVYLPVINGDDVTKILKKDGELKHIPIILISATTKTLAERTMESGASAYLAKPFEPEELAGKVEEILAQGANL